MTQATLDQIIAQLETLEIEELQQLNQVIQKYVADKQEAIQQSKFHQALLTCDFFKQLKKPDTSVCWRSPMSLQELKEQACQLSLSDRLALISAIVQSLQNTLSPQSNRKALIEQMRGVLKTDQPPPTDAQVEFMLEEHRAEKYLK